MMARRRKIEAPSPEDLARIDEARAPKAKMPPIAQIAGEAAALSSPLDADRQEERAEAEALRRLRAEGWEVRTVPMAEIHADAMTRDRMRLEDGAMEELRQPIRRNGLRMPIEVSQRDGGGFDLISGLRRLTAMRDVAGQGGVIRVLVRPAQDAAAMLGAMIEENEIRADLSSYERGRAAALSVQDGVFPDIEAAVNALFASASKAKRSKVRSFARLHEELGDLLAFPQDLSERQCLKLAAGLKAGQGAALRRALGTGQGTEPALEWGLMDAVLRNAAKPAAPRKAPKTYDPAWVPLSGERFIHHEIDAKGHAIRFEGAAVDAELVEVVMAEIARVLGAAEAPGDGPSPATVPEGPTPKREPKIRKL